MSGYFKRVLILKNLSKTSEKCIVKIEKNNLDLNVKTEIFCGDKSYLLALSLNGEFYALKIGKNARFTENFNTDCEYDGASALLVKDDDLTPIAYGFDGRDFLSYLELLNKLKTHSETALNNYDDEVIASENYYLGELDESKPIYNGSTIKDGEIIKEAEKAESIAEPLFYEESDIREQNERYYDTVKSKIEEILSDHEEDLELKKALGGGRFAKINYDDERYYIVGTLSENDVVKYVLYAVPGSYSFVPNELKPFTRFIPLTPFQPLGSGFYVIFQNADDGEIVTN